jgi:tetratricopeptide (TPR) repeat protein
MYFKQERMVKPALPFSWNRDFVWGLLLVAATFLAYQPAWNGQLVWDDDAHITHPELRSIDGLSFIWTHPRGTVQYFPLVHTVFWVESHLWGNSTLGYHLLNILLHVFSALILVRILRKLDMPGEAAWLAGGIFALHPVMVESVAWISELKNTLSGVFFLSTALTYLTYTETGKRRSYISALGLFILALLSKTTIAPFPLAMLAVVWWKRGGLLWRRDVMPLLPFIAPGILFGLITIYVERTYIGTRGPEFEFSLIERCLIAGRALWFYLGKVFLPVNLMISYPRWVLNAAVWWQYLFPSAALMAGCILWAQRKAWRAPAAAYFYFTAMLLPCLGFISFYTFRYSFVADHYQYLAAIGPIVLGVVLVDKVVGLVKANEGVLKPAVTVMLLLALGTLSWNQSRMYSDVETLFRTTIRKNPDSWMAHNNLGLLLEDKGRTDEALAHYRKALELNPNYAESHSNLGIQLVNIGRTDEAAVHFQKAFELDHNLAKNHNNVGLLLAKIGQSDEAMTHFLKALEINPNYGDAHYNLGLLLANMGRTDEAMAHYQKALELNRNLAKTHNNIGILLAKMGRPDESMAHFQKALEINPNYGEAYYNLGLLLANMGRTDDAMAHYRKALELNPNHAKTHNNIGILLAQLGRSDEAIAHFRKVLEINPYEIGALKNITFILGQKGQWTDAAWVLQNALAFAKSTGDEARTKAIAQIITQLHEAINSSKVNLKTHAQ